MARGPLTQLLKTQLASCFALAGLAATEYNTGEEEIAGLTVAHVESGYEKIRRFLADPRHAKQVEQQDRADLERGLARLQEELEELKRKVGGR